MDVNIFFRIRVIKVCVVIFAEIPSKWPKASFWYATHKWNVLENVLGCFKVSFILRICIWQHSKIIQFSLLQRIILELEEVVSKRLFTSSMFLSSCRITSDFFNKCLTVYFAGKKKNVTMHTKQMDYNWFGRKKGE